MKKLVPLPLFMAILLSCNFAVAQEKLLVDNFENGLSPSWTIRSFQGDTLYSIVSDNGGQVLQATSSRAASGLTFDREFDVFKYPILSWRWKIENIIERGDASKKSTDDYAARIYVTFPHWYYPKTTSINYIWANQLAKGEIQPNAYTTSSMMFAVESGKEKVGQWIEVQRNLVDDYRQAFGKNPPRNAVLSIMTDTDNTGSSTRAWYDDIYLQGK